MTYNTPEVPSIGDLFKAEYSSFQWYISTIKNHNQTKNQDEYVSNLIKHMTSYEVAILTLWAGDDDWKELWGEMDYKDMGYIQDIVFDVTGYSSCCPKEEYSKYFHFIRKPFSEVEETSE